MAVKKKDFVEISFTGKTKDGEIFDSNIKEDLKQSGLEIEAKPLIIALGERMFLESVDDFLIGKEIGQQYEITLLPEKAFGLRDSKLIKMVPTRSFLDQNLNPRQGMMLNIDGSIAKVISVSSGRTLVDFNNPLAGKTIEYKIKIVRYIGSIEEKAKALIQFFSRQDFPFTIDETQKALTITLPEGFDKFFELFKDKFKDLVGLDLKFNIDKNAKIGHVHEDGDHEHLHHDHGNHKHSH